MQRKFRKVADFNALAGDMPGPEERAHFYSINE
jgi:hypothetical protein